MTCVNLLILIIVANFAVCQRRIVGGKELLEGKSYMVYIVWSLHTKSPKSKFWAIGGRDEYTLCGGVILNPSYILSSAACFAVKPFLTVVAGYRKYVPNAQDPKDKCLAIAKRRIIYKCYYKCMKDISAYNVNYYNNKTFWTSNDIAVGLLNKPYDFSDKSYLKLCSYIPSAAKLIYSLPKVGTDVVVIGWGAPKYMRPKDYYYDVNQKYLMATSTVIIDYEQCKATYKEKHNIIWGPNRICTNGKGRLEADGTYRGGSRRDNSNQTEPSDVENEVRYALDIEQVPSNDTVLFFNTPHNITRRNGPCQNDHGGPLVTWIEGEEYVNALIVGFLVNDNMECVGPYIYRKINELFINCSILKTKDKTLRTRWRCDDPPEARGYDIEEEHISWD